MPRRGSKVCNNDPSIPPFPPSTPPYSPQETEVVWYPWLMLALTFAIKSTAPWPWLQDSSFPSLPAPFLNKPFSRLHPQAAVHTEWAVLSQCFSPDPWELCKAIKEAGEESEIETDRKGGRRGRRPTIDFQITLAFMSCPDTVSFWPFRRNPANSLKYLPSIFILSISPLIVPLK